MDYFFHIGTLFLIYLLLAESMNIYLGYTGILALSHIAFYAIGAYAGALVSLQFGHFWLGMIVGAALAGLLGLLLGLTSIKLTRDYLGIATLGFAQIVSSVLQNWEGLTRGPLGLPGIPRPTIFGFSLYESSAYFLFTAAITFVLMIFMYRLIKSPFGRVLEMIRDDEIAAKSLGKNTLTYKLTAFSVGAIIAACAGTLYAHLITYIAPSSFQITELSLILVMTVLGGLGTFRGPFLGVFFILLIQEGVTFLPGIPATMIGGTQLFLYSFIFLVTLIHFPQGLGGFWKHGQRRKKQFTRY